MSASITAYPSRPGRSSRRVGGRSAVPRTSDPMGLRRDRPQGDRVVTQGGSYLCHAACCRRYRPAGRIGSPPDSSAGNLGFRCARRRRRRRRVVELEGFEPSSVECEKHVLRPFPCAQLVATAGPGARFATSSPWCSRLSDRQPVSPGRPPPLLLPGCGDPAPRAIAGRDVSRFLASARRRERRRCRRLCWLPPFSEPGQLGSHASAHGLHVETSQPRVWCRRVKVPDQGTGSAPSPGRRQGAVDLPLGRRAWPPPGACRGTAVPEPGRSPPWPCPL